jgi:hypothetical protein
MWRNLISNCAKMALPKVSAVMPVPSDTKKTLGWGMKNFQESSGVGAKEAPYGPLTMFHYPNFATQTFDPFEKHLSRRAAWPHPF